MRPVSSPSAHPSDAPCRVCRFRGTCPNRNAALLALTVSPQIRREQLPPSVIETYCNTFQSLMRLRGGFAMVDSSVRRLKRPVADRLIVLALKVRHSVPKHQPTGIRTRNRRTDGSTITKPPRITARKSTVDLRAVICRLHTKPKQACISEGLVPYPSTLIGVLTMRSR